eukprot:3726184-Pleurochrysis_carterae.AAC.1
MIAFPHGQKNGANELNGQINAVGNFRLTRMLGLRCVVRLAGGRLRSPLVVWETPVRCTATAVALR